MSGATVTGLDHIQLAIPPAGEGSARAFYGELLGLAELPKPAELAGRGGVWFALEMQALHLGIETPFLPARKAHPAFLVADLEQLQARLTAAGLDCVRADGEIPGVTRCHTADPFGNRVDYQQR